MNAINKISSIKKSVPASLLGRPSLNKLIIHSLFDWLIILASVCTYLSYDNIYLQATPRCGGGPNSSLFFKIRTYNNL